MSFLFFFTSVPPLSPLYPATHDFPFHRVCVCVYIYTHLPIYMRLYTKYIFTRRYFFLRLASPHLLSHSVGRHSFSASCLAPHPLGILAGEINARANLFAAARRLLISQTRIHRGRRKLTTPKVVQPFAFRPATSCVRHFRVSSAPCLRHAEENFAPFRRHFRFSYSRMLGRYTRV